MATTRHKSLVGRGGRKVFVRDKGLAQVEKNQHTDISNLKKKIRANRIVKVRFERCAEARLFLVIVFWFKSNSKNVAM